MPNYIDLDLTDLEFKSDNMDATLLLETFNNEEMDIWNNYNLFTDDTMMTSAKDSIKTETTDGEIDCLSSICPNDLINNFVLTNANFMQPNDYVHYNSSQHNPMQYVQYNTNNISANTMNLKYPTVVNDVLNETDTGLISIKTELIEDDYNSNNTSSLLCGDNNGNEEENNCLTRATSICSNSSSNSSNTSHADSMLSSINDANQINSIDKYQQQTTNKPHSSSLDFLLNNIQVIHSYPIVQTTHKNLNLQTQINHHDQQQQQQQSTQQKMLNIINTKPPVNKPTGLQGNQPDNAVMKNQKNVLPPSPPSSLGSDSESNHSIPGNEHARQTPQLKCPSAMVKKIRHQPYVVNKISGAKTNESTKESNTIKSHYSRYSTDYIPHSALNPNMNDECWPFLCSLNKLPNAGPLLLTEEEKRTLKQENLDIPTQLPLSKSEEKILKKIRRKIKNKISAQESRRKKKEYVDSLEKRVDVYISENIELKKRLDELEQFNKNLLAQLQKVQNTLNLSNTNQFGTIIMVIILFFAVVLGFWSLPIIITKNQMSSTTTTTAANNNNTTTTTTTSTNTATKTTNTVNTIKLVTVAAPATTTSTTSITEVDRLSPSVPVTRTTSDVFGCTYGTDSSNVVLAVDDDLMSFDIDFDEGSYGTTTTNILSNSGFCDGSANFASNSYTNHNSITANLARSSSESIIPIAVSTNSGRSKTGNAVELTKVRPFAPKPTQFNINQQDLKAKKNLKADVDHQSEYAALLTSAHNEPQIILLNLPTNSMTSSATSATKATTITHPHNNNNTNKDGNGARLSHSNPTNILRTTRNHFDDDDFLFDKNPQFMQKASVPSIQIINTAKVNSQHQLNDTYSRLVSTNANAKILPSTTYRLITSSGVQPCSSIIKLSSS